MRLGIVREKLGDCAIMAGFQRAVMSHVCTSNFRMCPYKVRKLLPILGDEYLFLGVVLESRAAEANRTYPRRRGRIYFKGASHLPIALLWDGAPRVDRPDTQHRQP
jgi:hypothetical protein